MMRLWAIGLVLFFSGVAHAEDKAYRELVVYEGDCSARIANETGPCERHAVYAVLNNGRITVSFTKGNLSYTLAGNKDRQPKPTDYYVIFDRLLVNEAGTMKSINDNVEGECHFSMNETATEFYSIKCDIHDRVKGDDSHFYLENIKGHVRNAEVFEYPNSKRK